MNVLVYAVLAGLRWVPCYSIAWEVDWNYWQDARFRESVGGEPCTVSEIVKVSQMVSIDLAEATCLLLRQRWQSDVQGVVGNTMQISRDLEQTLAKLHHELRGENSAMTEWNTTVVDVKRNARSVELYRVDARQLIALARDASARLAGRALLLEEAVQLQATAPHAVARPLLLAAWQLASLQGSLQLIAAVAPPEPLAPPRGRWGKLLGQVLAAFPRAARERHMLACRRCGSGKPHLRRTACAACEQHACAYCEACINMGRSRQCGLLLVGAPPPREATAPARREAKAPPPREATASPPSSESPQLRSQPQALQSRWSLSAAQSQAAADALQFLHRQQTHPCDGATFLLWAVTGAGKTEMIFPLLEAVLRQGGRVLVATPRRDVVLELAPRIAKAFPDYTRVVLYGGSDERWQEGALTLATTHQLIRFQEAFDLVLIDEMDAFPYHNDPMLHFAATKCTKRTGATIYLSATPPQAMQRAVARGKLSCARVPVRFHGHTLPVPKRNFLKPIALHTMQIAPKSLLKLLRHSIDRGAQLFLFVPYVKQVEPLVNILRNSVHFMGIEEHLIDGTSSKDEHRTHKVTEFRNRNIRVLVTTTILERGVTISKSDVFVLNADNAQFDAAALVQMAGRAGRSLEDPCGLVYFVAPRFTDAQRQAIRQITNMNRLAVKQGYIKSRI
ncbi:MAG: helicase-related protein [Candidatus Cohnella colombiensis]|uniref:Helicase-related protein n=1 Tax=Candidatus Cohnella colombiensis TaxID=3121368 RepID=A0AA95EVI4_9BACL|nr:MAG: helicase-related protein [Cohnella sp.]